RSMKLEMSVLVIVMGVFGCSTNANDTSPEKGDPGGFTASSGDGSQGGFLSSASSSSKSLATVQIPAACFTGDASFSFAALKTLHVAPRNTDSGALAFTDFQIVGP